MDGNQGLPIAAWQKLKPWQISTILLTSLKAAHNNDLPINQQRYLIWLFDRVLLCIGLYRQNKTHLLVTGRMAVISFYPDM